MPLPTPYELNTEITKRLAKKAGCSLSWAEHSHPLTLAEFMAIKKEISRYLTDLASLHVNEVTK